MHKHFASSLMLFIFCVLLGAACTKPPTPGSGGNLAPLKLSYSFISGTQVVVAYAKEKGIFAEFGLDVEVQQLGRGAKAMTALIAGEVSICQVAGASVIHAAAAGEDVVIIGGLYNTHLYSLMVRPEIKTAADLRGKALAISQPGSGSDSAMKTALGHLQLRPEKDVSLLMIGSQAERLAAMETGQIAGTLVTAPETVKAKEKGYHELLNLAALKAPYQSAGIVTTRRFVSQHRTVVLNLLQALATAISRMKQDREGVYDVLAKSMKLDRKTELDLLEEGFAVLVRDHLNEVPTPTLEGLAAEIKQLANDNPNIARLQPEQLVDLSLLRELEQEGFFNKRRP